MIASRVSAVLSGFVGLGGFGVFGIFVGFCRNSNLVIKSFFCILKINAEKDINKKIVFLSRLYLASKYKI